MVLSQRDLVICARGVVCPCCLLHNFPRNSLKVHHVVALLKNGHSLDACLSFCFLWIRHSFLLLNSIHVHLAHVLALIEVLVQGIWRVDRVELVCGIFASILEDDLGAAGMLRKEFGYIISTTVDDDPAGIARVVLCDLLAREFLSLRFVLHNVGCGVYRMMEKQKPPNWAAKQKILNTEKYQSKTG